MLKPSIPVQHTSPEMSQVPEDPMLSQVEVEDIEDMLTMPPMVSDVESSEDEKPIGGSLMVEPMQEGLEGGREARQVKKDASKLIEEYKDFDEILSKLIKDFGSMLKIDGAESKHTMRAILDKTANLEMRQCIEGGSSVNDAIRHKIAEIHIKIQKIIDYFKQNPHLNQFNSYKNTNIFIFHVNHKINQLFTRLFN